jgi:hypothetical protein
MGPLDERARPIGKFALFWHAPDAARARFADIFMNSDCQSHRFLELKIAFACRTTATGPFGTRRQSASCIVDCR